MKLSYRKLGAGKPLFILHGLFGSADNWQTIGKHFAEYFTVYFIDQRNHGQSPHSNEWNYEVMSEDIEELMRSEGLDKTMLLGHSMGGKTAMFFTVKHPERVEKLVVVDIGPKKYPITNEFVISAIDRFDPKTVKSRKEADELMAPFIEDYGTRQFLLKNLYWDENQQLAWKFNYEVIKQNIKNVSDATPMPFDPIELPVLFVKGEKSDYIFPSDIKLMNSMFTNAKLITISGAGHWVHADKPQDFFKEVSEFLLAKESVQRV
ncbi:MAG TPA: alpha/beta fold hydrolase [Bacteroidia bacterium]|jgi:esterase|nr:alpha/beta fold hydrolase [Bacteroidia bacterium]